MPFAANDANTVAVVVPVTDPSVAVIVPVGNAPFEPLDTPVARPPAVIVTADWLGGTVQATDDVRSSVEPSVYVPVAVNCCDALIASDGFVGVTWIDTSAATVTVIVAELDVIPPDVALIVVVPVPTVLARP